MIFIYGIFLKQSANFVAPSTKAEYRNVKYFEMYYF